MFSQNELDVALFWGPAHMGAHVEQCKRICITMAGSNRPIWICELKTSGAVSSRFLADVVSPPPINRLMDSPHVHTYRVDIM